MRTLVVDMGGSGARAKVAIDGDLSSGSMKISFGETTDEFAKGVAYWANKERVDGVFFGCASFDTVYNDVLGAPNLPTHLVGHKFPAKIAMLADIPVAGANDVYTAACGEAYSRGGNFILVNLGTGVNAKPIVNGKVLFAGAETGHIQISPSRHGFRHKICPCGAENCAEAHLGGLALVPEIKKAIDHPNLADDDFRTAWPLLDAAYYGKGRSRRQARRFYSSFSINLGRYLAILFGAFDILPVVFRGGVIKKIPRDEMREFVFKVARREAADHVMNPTVLRAEVEALEFSLSCLEDVFIGGMVLAEERWGSRK